MGQGKRMPESTFGLCSGNDGTAHEIERRDIGVDRDHGEVSVFRCLRCGRCWLHYLMEYEYLTAAGRWLEGEIPADVAAKVKPGDALKLFGKMESYYRGGSAYGGQVLLSQGPPDRWLFPFPGK